MKQSHIYFLFCVQDGLKGIRDIYDRLYSKFNLLEKEWVDVREELIEMGYIEKREFKKLYLTEKGSLFLKEWIEKEYS